MTDTLAVGTPLDEIDLAGRRWHAVVVKPLVQSGPIAVKALLVRGWHVLRPMCRELITRNGQRAEVERTMFGRYVFVGASASQEAHALRFVPGVQHPVIDARRRPLVLRPDVLAAVVTRLRADGGIADMVPRDPGPRFVHGQIVRVLEGPFAGFEGLFEGDESARVRVLLSLFGRPTVVKVPASGVVAAE